MHGPLNVKHLFTCVILGFRRDIDEICALLVFYAAYSGNSVPTFRDDLWIPHSTIKKYWTYYYCNTNNSNKHIVQLVFVKNINIALIDNSERRYFAF